MPTTPSSEDDSDISVPPIVPPVPGEDGDESEFYKPIKQLYSVTGYNLSVQPDGKIKGTQELFNKWAVLQFSSVATGHVRIKGVESQRYLAMDDQGRLHGKEDGSSDDTIFIETMEKNFHISYLSKKHRDKEWYVGIKKSGKPKNGKKTAKGQKATQFLPRQAYPST